MIDNDDWSGFVALVERVDGSVWTDPRIPKDVADALLRPEPRLRPDHEITRSLADRRSLEPKPAEVRKKRRNVPSHEDSLF